MRSSKSINTDITETTSEIEQLKSKRSEIQQELDKIQRDLSMLLDAKQVQEQISNLNTQRQMIDEGIAKREETLRELQQELATAESDEVREQRIQTCIKQAKKANAFNEKYIKLMENLDAELVSRITEINTAYNQLHAAAKSFFNTLELLEPATKRSRNDPTHDEDMQQAVQDMIDTIEETGNVDTATARSSKFTSDRHHRKTNRYFNHPSVKNFGNLILNMRNIQFERERRKAS